MTPIIIGGSVQGASHLKRNVECQDSYLIIDGTHKHDRNKYGKTDQFIREVPEDVKIIALADGHGSSSCPYSKTGSKTAVNVFCDTMVEYAAKYNDEMKNLFLSLNQEGETTRLARWIITEWENRITKVHKMNHREIPLDKHNKPDYPALWKQYGTTLLGMLITKDFVFAFQLGDGDITFVTKKEVLPVIEGDKILGVETHSISKPNSWTKVHTRVICFESITEYPFMYVLSSDGWINSHASEEEFHKTCRDYLEMIQEKGPEVVEDNLNRWLCETSRDGCGDDITTIFVYFN